jgi:glycosyltransferase involved in cell wall biosynthesis
MNKLNVFAHCSYIGTTGINNHSRNFLRNLSYFCNLKVRNFTIGKSWEKYTQAEHDKEPYINSVDKGILYQQTLWTNGRRVDYPIYNHKEVGAVDVNLVSDITDHYYYYDNYNGPKIGYYAWESTKVPKNFFNRLREFDGVFVPSEWQKRCLEEQGMPREKIYVVPEGVDGNVFNPTPTSNKQSPSRPFTFVVVGRWEHRKSTKEIIDTFRNTFDENENVKMVLLVDNWCATDGFKSTEERVKHFGFENDKRLKFVGFCTHEEYLKYISQSNVFVSCARGEGWNLPLIEAMACGTPAIYSNCSGQTGFTRGRGLPVNIIKEVEFPGEPEYGNYYEPDFSDLGRQIRHAYKNYSSVKKEALSLSLSIRDEFGWDRAAAIGMRSIEDVCARYTRSQLKAKRRKIVYVAPHLSTGGMPQYLLKKIQLIHKDFDVYCIEHECIATCYVVQRNKIQELLGERFISLSGKPKEDLLTVLNDIDPDIVHFEEFPETFIHPEIAKKIYKKDRKYLIFESYHGVYFRPQDKAFFPDKFLFVSELQADLYKGNTPFDIVEYPIEDLTPDKKRSQQELGLDENLKHVLNVGLFTKGKNQGELMRYARLLKDEPFMFHFVGNQASNFEDYWGPLMKDLPKNCVVWGEKTREETEKFYQAADLMVFVSKMETSPLVIKEALSWKMPALIYNLPAYKDQYSKFPTVKYLKSDDDVHNTDLIKKTLLQK